MLIQNRRYGLRPRRGPSRPVKKVTFDEPQDKVVENPPVQPQNELQEKYSTKKSISNVLNFERELERVKIPIPLSELSSNLGYKQQVSKWIQSSIVDDEGHVISLQYEKPSIFFGLV